MHYLILDTSILLEITSKGRLRKYRNLLISFVNEGRVKLIIPELVLEEWERNKNNVVVKRTRDSILEKIKNAKQLAEDLEPLAEDDAITFKRMISRFDTNSEIFLQMVGNQINITEGLLHHRSTIHLNVSDEVKTQAVEWSLQRKAPFHKKHEMADCLILFSSLEHVRENSLQNCLFVTLNQRDFGDSNTQGPHPDLVERFNDANTIYCNNIASALNEVDPSIINDEDVEAVDRFIADEWLRNVTQVRSRNLPHWSAAQDAIFGVSVPDSARWTEISDVIAVINILASVDGLCHILLPSGGGAHLTGVRESTESGCIEIEAKGCPVIIKVEHLEYSGFPSEAREWAYFRIESSELEATGLDEFAANAEGKEFLLEIFPGLYEAQEYWHQGYYGYDESGEEKELPNNARLVCRFLHGSFLIVAESSVYNLIDRYEGYHNQFSGDGFREFMTNLIDDYKEKGSIFDTQSNMS